MKNKINIVFCETLYLWKCRVWKQTPRIKIWGIFLLCPCLLYPSWYWESKDRRRQTSMLAKASRLLPQPYFPLLRKNYRNNPHYDLNVCGFSKDDQKYDDAPYTFFMGLPTTNVTDLQRFRSDCSTDTAADDNELWQLHQMVTRPLRVMGRKLYWKYAAEWTESGLTGCCQKTRTSQGR